MASVIAHISDFHCPMRIEVRPGEILNKRVLGLANLRFRREKLHSLDILSTLLRHLAEKRPDLTVITGDLVNLALDEEFMKMDVLLRSSGLDPGSTILVPGNHDRYLRSAAGSLERRLSSWVPESVSREDYPYLRRMGPIAVIGISSAVPRGPFRSAGLIGPTQLERIKALIDRPEIRDQTLLILCHHPPFPYPEPIKNYEGGLEDWPALLSILRERPTYLLHGHLHVFSHRILRFRHHEGSVTAVGATSASRRSNDPSRQAAYHLYSFEGSALVKAERCRLDPDGGTVIQETLPEPISGPDLE